MLEARTPRFDEAGKKRRPTHHGLAAPMKRLRRLDREVGTIFKTRYPTRYANWFYTKGVRRLVAPIVAVIAFCILAAVLRASPWVVLAGEIALIAGMIAFGVATIPAVLQICWQAARALADSEDRVLLTIRREDAALRCLRTMESDALKLCRQRWVDTLATLSALSLLPVTVAGGVLYWFGPDVARTFAATHVADIAWISLAIFAIGVVGIMMYATARRNVYLLTVALGEDPRDVRLMTFCWWPRWLPTK